ncbi:hypothetical protein IW01_19530 [Pectobacterium brasiliense]|uniref:hypothetical protein n=1 Tax=Pectobacterium brasiliense TaxID=180957 RepID=UPI0004E6068C|nr:hypothetical protein [Pectobacterium brasiliense]KFF63529.1 hypothetical protein IW01_19530 [Pectobacterium brasiliense]
MRFYFIGWHQDYERDSIASIDKRFDVTNVMFNIFFIFLAKKIKWINNILRKRLRSINENDVIIIHDSLFFYDLVKGVKAKKIIIFRNTITEKTVTLSKLTDFKKYSFDPDDCKKYNFIYLRQFSSLKKDNLLNGDELEWDFYFLGSEKNRAKELGNLINVIDEKGYKRCFIIKKNPVKIWERVICKLPFLKSDFKPLSYNDYISQLKKTRVIVDIVNPGQSGLTLRVLEALFMNKKIITNNKKIMEYDFYCQDNIIVVNTNDITAVENMLTKDFVYGPVITYPDSVKLKYSAGVVLDSLLNDLI